MRSGLRHSFKSAPGIICSAAVAIAVRGHRLLTAMPSGRNSPSATRPDAVSRRTASVTDAAFIILPEIRARGGNINVTGDYLAGSGQLLARGDAKIEILNSSTAFLRTDALTIPEDAKYRPES